MRYIPALELEDIHKRIDHFSASQISMIMGCKFKWACRYIYGVRPTYRKSQMLEFGNFFHNAARDASVMGKSRVMQREILISKIYNSVTETSAIPKETYPEIVDTFLELYGNLDLNNENTEVPVGGTIPGCKLNCTGFIDHIIDNSENKLIIDLKIKGNVSHDKDGNAVFSDTERIQQGLYSHFTGIKTAALYILHINKRKNGKKAEIEKALKTYDDNELNKILEICKMHIREMYSGVYPPNRQYVWCNSNMCEYWRDCHEIWGS